MFMSIMAIASEYSVKLGLDDIKKERKKKLVYFAMTELKRLL